MKNKKGITLIALVITIIVLLILAGVSLNLVLGEEGIVTKATNSGKTHNLGAAKEKVELLVATYGSDYYQAKYVNGEAVDAKIGNYVAEKLLANDNNSSIDEYTLVVSERNVTLKLGSTPVFTGTVQDNGKIGWEGMSVANNGQGDENGQEENEQASIIAKLTTYFSKPQSEIMDNGQLNDVEPIMDAHTIQVLDFYFDYDADISNNRIAIYLIRYHENEYVMLVEDQSEDPWNVTISELSFEKITTANRDVLVIPNSSDKYFYEKCSDPNTDGNWNYAYTEFHYTTIQDGSTEKTGYTTYRYNNTDDYYEKYDNFSETGTLLTYKGYTYDSYNSVLVTNDNIMHTRYSNDVFMRFDGENYEEINAIRTDDNDCYRFYDNQGNLLGTQEHELISH